MAKYVDTFYRVANRAYMYDSSGNLYQGEQLMLALLLHSKGDSRTMDSEQYVGRLLDDPNQKGKKHGHSKHKAARGPLPSR